MQVSPPPLTSDPSALYRVGCVAQVRDEFAPHGAARFVELVSDKYYDGVALHRAVEDICMGFGIAKDVDLRRKWTGNTIPDDSSAEPGLPPPRIPFVRGVVSFAGSGPDSRDVNLIIPYRYLDYMGNVRGDAPWEVPIGYVETRKLPSARNTHD